MPWLCTQSYLSSLYQISDVHFNRFYSPGGFCSTRSLFYVFTCMCFMYHDVAAVLRRESEGDVSVPEQHSLLLTGRKQTRSWENIILTAAHLRYCVRNETRSKTPHAFVKRITHVSVVIDG